MQKKSQRYTARALMDFKLKQSMKNAKTTKRQF